MLSNCGTRPARLCTDRAFALAVLLAAGVAGSVSTLVQLALWWLGDAPVWALLQRDTRMAAAIVLGPGALTRPLQGDGWVVATLLHGALSLAYAFIIQSAARGSPAWRIALGAGAGCVIYGLNMYGFTLLFPWFAASREAVTFAAHIVFGICAALDWPRLLGCTTRVGTAAAVMGTHQDAIVRRKT